MPTMLIGLVVRTFCKLYEHFVKLYEQYMPTMSIGIDVYTTLQVVRTIWQVVCTTAYTCLLCIYVYTYMINKIEQAERNYKQNIPVICTVAYQN